MGHCAESRPWHLFCAREFRIFTAVREFAVNSDVVTPAGMSQIIDFLGDFCLLKLKPFGKKNTVDGSEIRLSPVEGSSLSLFWQGFIHLRWLLQISSINSMSQNGFIFAQIGVKIKNV